MMRKVILCLSTLLLAGKIFSQPPINYCVENDITHAFLNDFSYEGLDLKISYVMDYFNRPHDYRLDAPRPVRLSWTHDPDAEAQRVEVSELSTYADSIVFTIHKDSAGYFLYNMIPGKIYHYRIVSTKGGNDTTVGFGQIEPTGMLRWLLAEGTWNVRDMGGWPGLGGHPIKYGQLFRGGQLTNPNSPYDILLKANGIQAMRNAGIRAELDLRSSSQAHYTTTAIAGTGYAADFTNIATTSARMWQYDKDDSNIKAIQWVINELKAGKPVFYHCQNGADRTGTIGFLIGALLGMSESDLAKDYELTTFCQKAVVDFDDSEVGFARLRNYEGKKGSVDGSSDPKDYMFAPLIDKLNTISGVSIQRKIYNFFKNGVNGTKISEADLDWFIKEMVDYVLVKNITIACGTSLNRNPGDTDTIKAVVVPANATRNTITYRSSDTLVAKVSPDGIISTVGRGRAVITVSADDYSKSIVVNVPLVESYVSIPDTVKYGDRIYVRPATVVNLIKNGSFEYGHHFQNWTGANEKNLSSAAFEYRNYAKGDSVYLQSKADGDSASYKSLRTMWKIEKGKSYVFGYKVRNSTDKPAAKNPNLATSLVAINNSLDADIDDFGWDDTPSPVSMRTAGRSDADSLTFEFPTYGSEWTDVQYAFTNTGYQYIQVWFTHLSQGGNNTCLDNFYLCEMTDVTSVSQIKPSGSLSGKIYNLAGQEVENPGRGIYIRDGKKYIIR